MNLDELPSGIKHFIEFIKEPSKNLTHLSKKHRVLIAKYLLNQDYNHNYNVYNTNMNAVFH